MRKICSLTNISNNDGKAAYLKNDYRSVITRIGITLICYIVHQMVAISTCNKGDTSCRKHSEL